MNMIIRAVAVSERETCHVYLREKLPDAVWCFDIAKSARDTFHRALKMQGNSPCLHLEDDILLCQGFQEKVLKIIACHPDMVIQFFSMRRADITIGARIEPGRTFMMNQCFYLPAGIAPQLLEFFPSWKGATVHKSANDIFIADFLKLHKMKYFLSVPSLVQHRQIVSTIDPRRSRFRQSLTFQEGDV